MKLNSAGVGMRCSSFEREPNACYFFSFRDDVRLVSFRAFADAEERRDARAVIDAKCETHDLVPAVGSTISSLDDFKRITESPVLEIRQYKMKPGSRARFAPWFRDRTLESHDRLGMPIYGQYDDLGDENGFTFFRGFRDLVQRERVKAEFYGGEYWLKELEKEAFSMIEDYSNVLLVTPV